MSNRALGLLGLVCTGAVLLAANSAQADEAVAPAAEPPATGAPASAEAPAKARRAEIPEEEEVDEDGVRFRGGVSGGGGGLFLENYTMGIGGFDGRVGVQINDLIGVYAQPQVGVYGGDLGGIGGIGGLAGASVVVDFTFLDQIFVGAGGGFAILNNPLAGELHLRAGGYPLMGYGEDGVRRKGLMLSADVRMFFLEGYVLLSPTASIGYEAF
jgi:hypothetical protein